MFGGHLVRLTRDERDGASRLMLIYMLLNNNAVLTVVGWICLGRKLRRADRDIGGAFLALCSGSLFEFLSLATSPLCQVQGHQNGKMT